MTRMFTAVTLADGVVKVVDRAVLNLESVKGARKEICGAVEPLHGIENEANRLIGSLTLVKGVEALQTTGIGQQIYDIMVLASRLTASMMTMGAENRRRTEPVALKSSDYEYHHLETMLGQVRDARTNLTELISTAPVGLRGNARDGFCVARASLLDINSKVREVTGVNLVLFEQMESKLNIQFDALVKVDDTDAEHLGLPRISGKMVEQWRALVGEETGISRN
ncbi:hypothetical protein B0T17DRAFT_406425 [Bombardia bombarda]|uniref:Uncharacterized protein n=1 Tax=Bombardia bombarda TaxID=252184 RepID=A0AA39TZ77_9PEZI|nr:hypothetical protein B0T17DRAFT_406425 [Bombardia bombarda]